MIRIQTFAVGLMLSPFALSSAFAQSDSGDMSMARMMGGGCPMMGMMGRGMMDHDMMGRGMMRGKGMRRGRMGAMAAGRLAYLKAELNITEAQEAAWKEYETAARDRVSAMQGMRQGMMENMKEGTTLERMDLRIGAMEAMLETMKSVKPATEKLYAALTDDQKKIADDLIGGDCGAM